MSKTPTNVPTRILYETLVMLRDTDMDAWLESGFVSPLSLVGIIQNTAENAIQNYHRLGENNE